MKKILLSCILCFCSMLLIAAEAPETLTIGEAKSEVKALLKASEEIVGVFYRGLPYEDGDSYKDVEEFPYLAVKSDKYASVADIKKAAEKVMTKKAAKGVFYDVMLSYIPQYKDYGGKLYSCINSYNDQGFKFISWDTDTMELVSQKKGYATVKMRVFNPVVADSEESGESPYSDAFLDIEWENGGWRLASSPICSSCDPSRRPKDLKNLLEENIPEKNRSFQKPPRDVKVVWDIDKAEISFMGPEWITVHCPFKETGKDKNVYTGVLDFAYEEDKWTLLFDSDEVPEKFGNTSSDFFKETVYADVEPGTKLILKDYGPAGDYYREDNDSLPQFFEQIAREEFTGEYETHLDGAWAFILIPKEKNTRIEIFSLNEKGAVGDRVLNSAGKPVILFTGKDETKANSLIRVISPDGSRFQFKPVFNGIDGTVDVPAGVRYVKFESVG